jgi:tetratricopeptide (TPR) repeat protein
MNDDTYQTAYAAGETALRTGSTSEALVCFERALALAGDAPERAEVLAQMGRAYTNLGQHDQAAAALDEAVQAAQDSPAALARVRMHAGVVSWLRGDLQAARAYLEDAQSDFKRLGLLRDRAIALGNLGSVLAAIGEYQRAIAAIKQTIELQESLSDLPRVIINCSNLGEVYADLGDLDAARAYLQRAYSLAELIDKAALTIEPLRLLGRAVAAEGEPEEALVLMTRALELGERFQRTDLMAQALASLGELHLKCERMPEAEQIAGRLLALSGPVPRHRAEAQLILGHAWLARGEGARALETLQAGLLDAQASMSEMLVLRYHAALAQVVDRPEIARIHRRIAVELAEQIADALDDKDLQRAFRATPLVRVIGTPAAA